MGFGESLDATISVSDYALNGPLQSGNESSSINLFGSQAGINEMKSVNSIHGDSKLLDITNEMQTSGRVSLPYGPDFDNPQKTKNSSLLRDEFFSRRFTINGSEVKNGDSNADNLNVKIDPSDINDTMIELGKRSNDVYVNNDCVYSDKGDNKRGIIESHQKNSVSEDISSGGIEADKNCKYDVSTDKSWNHQKSRVLDNYNVKGDIMSTLHDFEYRGIRNHSNSDDHSNKSSKNNDYHEQNGLLVDGVHFSSVGRGLPQNQGITRIECNPSASCGWNDHKDRNEINRSNLSFHPINGANDDTNTSRNEIIDNNLHRDVDSLNLKNSEKPTFGDPDSVLSRNTVSNTYKSSIVFGYDSGKEFRLPLKKKLPNTFTPKDSYMTPRLRKQMNLSSTGTVLPINSKFEGTTPNNSLKKNNYSCTPTEFPFPKTQDKMIESKEKSHISSEANFGPPLDLKKIVDKPIEESPQLTARERKQLHNRSRIFNDTNGNGASQISLPNSARNSSFKGLISEEKNLFHTKNSSYSRPVQWNFESGHDFASKVSPGDMVEIRLRNLPECVTEDYMKSRIKCSGCNLSRLKINYDPINLRCKGDATIVVRHHEGGKGIQKLRRDFENENIQMRMLHHYSIPDKFKDENGPYPKLNKCIM